MLSLEALAGMIETVEFVPERMRAAAAHGYSTATDLADWLVREADVPFREAHHITGRAVKAAEERECDLANLPLEILQVNRRSDRPTRLSTCSASTPRCAAAPATEARRRSASASKSQRRKTR